MHSPLSVRMRNPSSDLGVEDCQLQHAYTKEKRLRIDFILTIINVLDEVQSACLRTSASVAPDELLVECEVNLSVSMPAFANVARLSHPKSWRYLLKLPNCCSLI